MFGGEKVRKFKSFNPHMTCKHGLKLLNSTPRGIMQCLINPRRNNMALLLDLMAHKTGLGFFLQKDIMCLKQIKINEMNRGVCICACSIITGAEVIHNKINIHSYLIHQY